MDARQVGTLALVAVTVAALGAALGQQEPAGDRPEAKAQEKRKPGTKARPKGGVRAVGGAVPKDVRRAGDPLDKNEQEQPDQPRWPYHYTFKLTGASGQTLTARFYPSRAKSSAPVVLLVHATGTGHSGRDFEERYDSLKGQSLAEHLQELEYAVMILDLPGHGPGAAVRREITDRGLPSMVRELQTAYYFLIDRHNRRELNLAKFAVIAVGDGANLALAWAASPQGAVSNPGRVSDLGALVLVSPVADAQGLRLAPLVNRLAPQLPMLIVGGNKDDELLKSVQPALKRHRLSDVRSYQTALQGAELLRFEDRPIGDILQFLEEPIKFRRNSEWEPRYLLAPVATAEVKVVQAKRDQPAARKDAPKAQAKDAPKSEEPGPGGAPAKAEPGPAAEGAGPEKARGVAGSRRR